MLNKLEQESLAREILQGKDLGKVTLVCTQHKRSYGSKKKPHFGCKQCMFVEYLGLIMNTPPEKREETLEMLEYSAHHLIEMEAKGQLDTVKLLKHPQVTIQKGN